MGATPLFLRIYDDEENFRRNVDIFCRCWGAHPVIGIDSIYANADPTTGAPRGTYTEVEGKDACIEGGSAANCAFTGYRSIRWGLGVVGNDVFGRLSIVLPSESDAAIRGLRKLRGAGKRRAGLVHLDSLIIL